MERLVVDLCEVGGRRADGLPIGTVHLRQAEQKGRTV